MSPEKEFLAIVAMAQRLFAEEFPHTESSFQETQRKNSRFYPNVKFSNYIKNYSVDKTSQIASALENTKEYLIKCKADNKIADFKMSAGLGLVEFLIKSVIDIKPVKLHMKFQVSANE